MQTFLPYPDFTLSAKVLDNKRLGKQRVEASQILKINLTYRYLHEENSGIVSNLKYMYSPIDGKIPWENHPAVLMWRGHEVSVAKYGCAICCEWIKRGYKDNQFSFFARIAEDELDEFGTRKNPEWLGNPKLHLSHQSNLLRKDWDYYINYFGENIQDITLPYYWPVKKEN